MDDKGENAQEACRVITAMSVRRRTDAKEVVPDSTFGDDSTPKCFPVVTGARSRAR